MLPPRRSVRSSSTSAPGKFFAPRRVCPCSVHVCGANEFRLLCRFRSGGTRETSQAMHSDATSSTERTLHRFTLSSLLSTGLFPDERSSGIFSILGVLWPYLLSASRHLTCVSWNSSKLGNVLADAPVGHTRPRRSGQVDRVFLLG